MSNLLSNQYELRFNPNTAINKYQVKGANGESMPQEELSTQLKAQRAILKDKLKMFICLGNIIYSPQVIEEFNIEGSYIYLLTSNYKGAFVLIPTGKLTSTDKEYQNLLSRFLKQVIRMQREMITVGNRAQKLFAPQRAVKHDDKGLQIWPGIECILTHHQKISTLTIDSAFKVLRQKTAFQEMIDLKNKNQLDRMAGEIVMTTYNKKFYKIERVNQQMTANSTFTNEKGESISFQEYYKKRYNVAIQNPGVPLLEATVKEKNKNLKEAQSRIIQLIPELCQMTGLTDEIRNNFHAMKAIATTTKPDCSSRMQDAANFVKFLQQNTKSKDGTERKNVLMEWGVQINPTPVQFPDKSLPPGALIMGQGKSVDIRTGNLDRDTQTSMYKNGTMARWAVFYSQRDQDACQNFLTEINKVNADFKFGLENPVVKTIADGRQMDQWEKAIEQVIQQASGPQNIHFFVFILPGPKKKAPLYTPIKQICINKFPVPSQVILFDTIKNGKGLRSICNKLCVQIVSKTGGVPWAISDIPPVFSREPTMIIGYDIFHKKSEQKPSQLAFCSTIDNQFARYHSQNIPSGEFSTHLGALCTTAITMFQAVNGKMLPKNIVVYRDGAGEGQEEVVKDSEIAQFRQAIEATGQKINLVFLLTNKRVSAKFYTSNRENPQPGSIVDSLITSGNDFYLISQKTTQGTVTPTQYKILHNDLTTLPDSVKMIQSLTFKLCYLYYNWTGSIKTPSPVRYAHCLSNFIGDRYIASEQKQFLPHESLIKRNSLFYI